MKRQCRDYRAAAQAVAAKHGLPIVDLNWILPRESAWLSKDGVHPSPAGNSIIAKHIAKAVAPLLPKPTAVNAESESGVYTADIVVYGATSAGVVAAVQAARMNKSVLLIEQKTHVGGLTTGGLGATDIGNKAPLVDSAENFIIASLGTTRTILLGSMRLVKSSLRIARSVPP